MQNSNNSKQFNNKSQVITVTRKISRYPFQHL